MGTPRFKPTVSFVAPDTSIGRTSGSPIPWTAYKKVGTPRFELGTSTSSA